MQQMTRRTRSILFGVLTAVLVAALWTTGAWVPIWTSLRSLAETIHARYGIDVPFAIVLFGIGELVFCFSIAMMLKEAGDNVSWRSIKSFKIKELNLGSRRMMGWLWLNRLSWVVPWLIVISMSMHRVPWWATLAGLAEVGSTLLLGIAVTAGFKLPWWNTTEGNEA
jgi:hypothetical protein